MNRNLAPRSILLALAIALPAAAHDHDAKTEMTPEQQAMMEAYQKAGTPGAPHEAMAKQVGTYEMSVKSWETPGTEPTTEPGTATRHMLLDGRVLVEEVSSTMHGQSFTGHGLHGYDNVSGKHWGTWNDSMSTGIMVSEGSCDDKGSCTFTGSWNDPITKGKTTARMTSRWTDDKTQVFEMFGPGPDDKEFRMMEITYTKKS